MSEKAKETSVFNAEQMQLRYPKSEEVENEDERKSELPIGCYSLILRTIAFWEPLRKLIKPSSYRIAFATDHYVLETKYLHFEQVFTLLHTFPRSAFELFPWDCNKKGKRLLWNPIEINWRA